MVITVSIKKGIDISTTTQLRNIIKDALKSVPQISEDEIKKSCQFFVRPAWALTIYFMHPHKNIVHYHRGEESERKTIKMLN